MYCQCDQGIGLFIANKQQVWAAKHDLVWGSLLLNAHTFNEHIKGIRNEITEFVPEGDEALQERDLAPGWLG